MARKSSSVISDEEQESTAREPYARSLGADESPLDQRMLDLDEEAESPFLRGQKRVPVRRGALPRNAAGRIRTILKIAAVVLVAGLIWLALERYGTHSWRFRLDSSDNITISGMNNVARSQILDVMASDIDRNIFFVPLEQRKKQLEQIPWVQSAAVMRLLPESPEDRGLGKNAGRLCRGQLAHRDDRRQRRDHGTAGEPGDATRSR